jgi:hypothetical protein
MKKFFARFAVLGLFAGLVATSYSLPARAAVADVNTAYSGVTGPVNSEAASEIYIYVFCDDYIYIFVFDYEVAESSAGTLANAITDRAFDAQ